MTRLLFFVLCASLSFAGQTKQQDEKPVADATKETVATPESKKDSPVILAPMQIIYWSKRAKMMEKRLDEINAQAARIAAEREFDAYLIVVRAICQLDEAKFAKENVLECAKP